MKDLTKGYPAKIIMAFAIPIMLGNILQQLYNLADSKIVSAYVGQGALAAVGATGVVATVMIGFLSGLTQGFAVPIANSFGAKDYARMKKNIAGTICLTLCFSLVFTLLALLFIKDILVLLHTPKDIMGDAVDYVTIIVIGISFTGLYNMSANILRAVGDSRTPLYCLMISVCLNVGLDLLFVKVFAWGIKGAAVATVLAQALSGIFCIIYILTSFREILPERESWRIEGTLYWELITSGISMALMSCVVNIGTVVLQSAINSLGTAIVTAHTAARRIFDVLTAILYSVGVTMTTYVSQNIGAGEGGRVRQGIRQAFLIVSATTTFLIILCYLGAEPVLKWIVSGDEPEIIEAAVMYCKISIVFFYVLGPLFILRCSLQGMGRKIIPICSSVLEMVIKVLSANFLVPAFAYIGVAFTEPISWCAMTLLLSVAYFTQKPKV